MRISDMLYAMAKWLENPNNEAVLLAEYDNNCLEIVTQSCVEAADILKKAAFQVDHIEEPDPSHINVDSIQDLAEIATAFDYSGNDKLQKQASVIDELLLTIAAPAGEMDNIKKLKDSRIEELKKKYQENKEKSDKVNKISEVPKQLDKSEVLKEYRIMESPLNTRYCPDHPGAQIARVGDNIYQCDLDKKVYDFTTGYTLNNGTKVPGGSVSEQHRGISPPYQSMFDDRYSRLNSNKV